jgi:hypothetical protein
MKFHTGEKIYLLLNHLLLMLMVISAGFEVNPFRAIMPQIDAYHIQYKNEQFGIE